MKSRSLAARVAAVAVGLLALTAAVPARALDIGLPGERKLEIHGFYETRLRFTGRNLPGNGVGEITFSAFRHVLDIETELDVLPEGWGPFDTLFFFSRWVFSYECIYERACGSFDSVDSFGGGERKLVRMPRNIEDATVQRVDAGGVFPLRYRPGSLQPISVKLNPGYRYRGCINPPGVRSNPSSLLGVYCNLNNRSQLDGPVDEFQGVGLNTLTRAGAFNRGLRSNLLSAARPRIGEARFGELRQQLEDREFLTGGQLGSYRALLSAAARAQAVGDSAKAAELGESAAAMVAGTFDDVPTTQELLGTRPDLNIFADPERGLATNRASELLSSQWGASELKDFILPYLATLDTPIEPLGYFGAEPLDLVNEFAAGLATNVVGLADVPGGLEKEQVKKGAVPFLVGGDGIRNTADDLPLFNASRGMMVTPAAPVTDAQAPFKENDYKDVIVIESEGEEVQFFGRLRRESVPAAGWRGRVEIGCDKAGGTFNFDPTGSDSCSDASGRDITEEVFRSACKEGTGNFSDGGINADGDCIRLGVFSQQVPFAALSVFSDRSLRPDGAELEPIDLTDFKLIARGDGKGLPARPRNQNKDGEHQGLYYKNPGQRRLDAEKHRIVSGLDVEFSEDRLRWGHGASDDENEFREGYLEFEMLDGNLYARVGKLILVWGKTELFRNQDRMNPLDISNGVITKLEESRIGQWMVDVVFSPEQWMRVGPVEDMRLELAVIFDDFEPTDLGPGGENSNLALVSLKKFGAMASGLAGIGLTGEVRPYHNESGLKRWDYAVRLEGRANRFTFAITDFWGWDDQAYPEVVWQYGRRADPDTGAPVDSIGGLVCKYRDANGNPTADPKLSVGPDGVAGNADDAIPTIGNCLLWDDPDPSGDPNNPTQQFLRASDLIALSHPANQTLFHTICTLTFDPDNGLCALDLVNAPSFFSPVSSILAGGFFSSLATDGFRWIRTKTAPFDGEFPKEEIENTMFKPISGTDLSNLSSDQKALLGCGPVFASPCGAQDVRLFTDAEGDDASIEAVMEGRTADSISGGPDLMNADASIVMQEVSILKLLQEEGGSAGALVGTRAAADGTHYFEKGVTHKDHSGKEMTPDDVIALGESGRNAFVAENNERQRLNKRMEDLRAAATELFGPDPNAVIDALDNNPIFTEIDDPYDAGYDKIRDPDGALVPVAADAWIEPLPWMPDPNWLQQGVLLYQVAHQNERDPRCFRYPEGDFRRDFYNPNDPACFDDQGVPKPRAFNDPTDPTNPLNAFRTDASGRIIGESCIQSFGDTARFLSGERALAFDSGCTDLETVTANFERLTIAFEIMGPDRVPDPPETLAELENVLSDNFTRMVPSLGPDGTISGGDPISGPDGILPQNLASGLGNAATSSLAQPFFEDREKDVHVVRLELDPQFRPGLVKLGQEDFRTPPEFVTLDVSDPDAIAAAARRFMDEYDPTTCSDSRCHLIIAEDTQLTQVEFNEVIAAGEPKELVAVLPVALAVPFGFGSDPNGNPDFSVLAPSHINFLELYYQDPEAAMNLLDEEFDDGPASFPSLVPVVIDGEQFFVSSAGLRELFLKPSGQPATTCQDLDGNSVCDFDQDDDGVYDGADDYTFGPATDDNILCGSGLPGDVLQDALQFEFVRESDAAAFQGVFPNGLPPRSPVFCRSLVGLLGATGQTLPVRRAGGDGSYGRRDFLWHGGRMIALEYQKRNVFGFAVDFAEDVTKTSWGIEFTWTANKLFSDLNEFDGLSSSDEMVLSISIDRPTFINYLNPNRSFFMNFQFFIRYLTDFNGGADDQDGMYGVAEGPVDGRAVFTFFTGYFQDRLQPRMTFIYDPMTSNGGILSQLQYRWTESFSTTVGMNHFFGRPRQIQQSYFPISLRTSTSDLSSEALTRSLSPVRNEDFAFITVRYSF